MTLNTRLSKYVPSRPRNIRWTPLSLCQIYTFVEASWEERKQESERPDSLNSSDLIFRFIKCLVENAITSTSFHISVALFRLIYAYSTEVASSVYSMLTPDNLSSRDAPEYSYIKAALMRRVKERFGEDSVELTLVKHGEHRFLSLPPSSEVHEVAQECLKRLLPWDEVAVALPDSIDVNSAIPGLGDVEAQDATTAHALERKRVYTMIDPDSFTRLVRASSDQQPSEQISIAHIRLPNHSTNSRASGGTPSNLSRASDEKMEWSARMSVRRARAPVGGSLRLRTDTEIEHRFEVFSQEPVRLLLPGNVKAIEILGEDEEGLLLLASKILASPSCHTELQTEEIVFDLEGGQEIQLGIVSIPPASLNDDGSFTIEVAYRETVRRRIIILALMRAAHIAKVAARKLTSDPSVASPHPSPPRALQERTTFQLTLRVVATVAILLFVVGTALWMWRRSNKEELVKTTPSPVISPQPQPSINPSPQPPAPILLVLNDGGEQVTLDAQGNLTGLESLALSDQQRVKTALITQKIEAPKMLKEIKGASGTVMGGSSSDSFKLISPVGKVVSDDQPTFRWEPLDGASNYQVTIIDPKAGYKVIAVSKVLSTTEWKMDRTLQRGRIYTWQVTARTESGDIKAPSRDAREARFGVLEQGVAIKLARARRDHAGRPLVLGLFYTQAGLLDEAEREFQALAAANPESVVAKNLLHNVRAKRRAR